MAYCSHGCGRRVIGRYVNQYQFDRLTAPNFLEGEPREAILDGVNSLPTRTQLRNLGADLLWVSIGHFGIEEKVKDQRLDTWGRNGSATPR